MGGAYGTPCSGELQFWTVVQSQMREQAQQLKRIADLLAARNQAENIGLALVFVAVGFATMESAFYLADAGLADPATLALRGLSTAVTEAHGRELIPDCPGGAR